MAGTKLISLTHAQKLALRCASSIASHIAAIAGAVSESLEELETTLTAHTDATDNPHGVTAEQIGAAKAGHTHGIAELDDTGEGDWIVLDCGNAETQTEPV